MNGLARGVTIAVLWLGVIPTHEYGHCLFYWAEGHQGPCETAFQNHYSEASGLAITNQDLQYSQKEAVGEHVAIYTVGLLQVAILPLAILKAKSSKEDCP